MHFRLPQSITLVRATSVFMSGRCVVIVATVDYWWGYCIEKDEPVYVWD